MAIYHNFAIPGAWDQFADGTPGHDFVDATGGPNNTPDGICDICAAAGGA